MSVPGETPGASPWPGRAAAAAIVAAAAAIYANSLANGFVFLDLADIVDNRTIRHLADLRQVLAPPSAGGLTVGGRPVLNLSLAVNYALGGKAPWGYHALNIIIHALAGVTLFGILRRTVEGRAGRPGPPGPIDLPRRGLATEGGPGRAAPPPSSRATLFAFVVALLWTVHPLQTESVSYVIQRAESLMGLFYLLTMYCFIRYAVGTDDESLAASTTGGSGSGTRKRFVARSWAAGAFLACLLGMGTKEVMVSAPVMVFLYDGVFLSDGWAAAWRRHGKVHAALAGCWAVVVALALGTGGRGGTSGFGIGISWWTYVLTQFPAVLHYLRLAFWPRPLVFDYAADWIPNPWSVAPEAAGVLGCAAAGAYLLFRPCAPRPAEARVSRARAEFCGRPVGFAIAFFFAILAPTSLVPGKSQTMSEHRMYLALIPVIALAVWGAWEVGRAGSASRDEPAGRVGPPYLIWEVAIFALLALALGWTTIRRNRDYRSNLTIWADTEAKRPQEARAYFNLGSALSLAGRPAEAIPQLEAALRWNADYPEAHESLGIIEGEAGHTEEAIAHYHEALRLRPAYAEAHYNLGTTLAESGEYAKAVEQFQAALRLQPDYPEAEDNLGVALGKMDRWPEAIAHCQRAVRLNSEDPKLFFDLGTAFSNADRADEAIGPYERALALKPDFAEAHTNLGAALAASNRLAEAIVQFRRAIELRPNLPAAHYNLGMVLRSAGKEEEAEAEIREADRLRGGQLRP